jgi:hypothetical protein
VNIWIGRLFAPQLTSWSTHSSYLGDSNMPGISIAALYNPTLAFTLGPASHADGVEVNGVVAHRIDYSVGWLSSGVVGQGLKTPNAQDLYAHVGGKIGGITLDGEGGSVPDNAMRPWEETSVTFDLFAYRGLTYFDNGTGANATNPQLPIGQRDVLTAIGSQMRLMVGSFQLTSGVQTESHSRPYPGLPGTAPDPTTTPPTPGANGPVDNTTAKSLVQYNELSYVVYPWLVPAIRTEFTRLNLDSPNLDPANGSSANLIRLVAGAATLVRPNIRVVVAASFERAHGNPPSGSWGAAGGVRVADPGTTTTLQAEQVTATIVWAY